MSPFLAWPNVNVRLIHYWGSVMKRFYLASLVVALAAGPSFAADMPVKAPLPPPPVYSWTGIYFGGFGGGLWSKTDTSFVFPPPATISQSSSQGIAGGIIGAQAQLGMFVTGFEANVGGFFNSNFGSGTCNPAASCTGGFTLAETLSHELITGGFRFGLAWDRWMVYGAAGYAETPFTQSICAGPCGVATMVATGDAKGAYYGGGVDVHIFGGWVAGAEYRHYEFDTQTWVPVVVATNAVFPANAMAQKLRFDTAVFRLTYLFGAPFAAPVTAKY
jgi:outer membrane immunogenic protein